MLLLRVEAFELTGIENSIFEGFLRLRSQPNKEKLSIPAAKAN
jgi:hypothetical protein